MGVRGPALQRPLDPLVGHRRPGRPRRAGAVGRPRARRRLPARQPAARRRGGAADAAVALPADQPPLRQPALSAHRGRRRVRRPAGGRPGRAAAAGGGGPRRQRRAHRPRRDVGGQATCAGRPARRPAHRRPGGRLPGLLPAGGRRARRVRHVVRPHRAVRHRQHQLARGAARSALPRRHRVRGAPRRQRGPAPLDAVAARRPAGRRPAYGPGRGHAPRRHPRSRGRGQPDRRRRLELPARAGHRHHRRRAPGRLLADRAGLEPAALAPRPAGRVRLRTGPGAGGGGAAPRRRAARRPRDRAVPALVDPAGRGGAGGDLRPLRPRRAHRHPHDRGPARRGGAGRRGPGQRRALGPRLPRRAGGVRDLDPLVRDRGRRPAAPAAVAAAVPGVGHDPRPAPEPRLPGRRPRPAPGRAGAADPRRRRGAGPRPRRPATLGRLAGRRRPAGGRTRATTRRCWPCTARSAARPACCGARR